MDAVPETLAISLLGTATFKRSREPRNLILAQATIRLLAYLVLFREPLRRERVAFALWPDDTEAAARANLRRQIHLVRSTFPITNEPWLLVDGRTVALNPRAPLSLDIDAFRRGISIAGERMATLDLYRGDLLLGIDAEWLDEPRRYYRDLFLEGALQEARAALGAGSSATAATLAQRVLAMDPWREDAVRLILESKIASGERAGAAAFYHDFAARLHSELEAAPDARTRDVFEQIDGDPHPKRVSSERVRVPLQRNLSNFINRERELAALAQMLEWHRVVTLTGPGGVGKSRLALEVASKISRRCEVINVRFGSASDDADSVEGRFLEGFGIVGSRELAADVIARTIDASDVLIFIDNADRVAEATAAFVTKLLERTAAARFLIASQRRLHLEGEKILTLAPLGVPAPEANLDEILRSESVRLFLDRARSIDAGFEVESTSIRHLASICRRLDGMPLPIELAAARTNVLTMPEIDARLSDRFEFLRSKTFGANEQHRTLRATLDWSYGLLDERERRAFLRLGVFANGWTLETAHAVNEEISEDDLIDCLSGLIEKSLVCADVTQNRRRYHFLESIRLYAAEHLDARGEREVTERFALRFYVHYVTERAREFRSSSEKLVFDELAAEHDNILVLLDFAISKTEYESAARLASDLVPFWLARGFANEAHSRLEIIVGRDAELPVALRARLRTATSFAYFRRGNVSRATRLANDALELAVAAEDELLVAEALLGKARCDYARESFDEAREALSRALVLFQAGGSQAGEAIALDFLAIVADGSQEQCEVDDLLRRSLALYETCGDVHGIATVNYHLGFGCLKRSLWHEASKYCERAIALWKEHGNSLGQIWAHYNLAWAEAGLGKSEDASRRFLRCAQTSYRFGFERELARSFDRLAELTMRYDAVLAVRCLARASSRREEYGDIVIAAEMDDYTACLERARGLLTAAAFAIEWQDGCGADERSLIDRLAIVIQDAYASPDSIMTSD